MYQLPTSSLSSLLWICLSLFSCWWTTSRYLELTLGQRWRSLPFQLHSVHSVHAWWTHGWRIATYTLTHTHTHTCTYISTVIFSYTYTCMIYVGIASACPNYLFVSSEIFSGFTWYVGSKFAMQKISLVERGMNKESKVYWTAITQLPITFTTLRQLRVVSECSIIWLLHAVGGMLCCIFLFIFSG